MAVTNYNPIKFKLIIKNYSTHNNSTVVI